MLRTRSRLALLGPLLGLLLAGTAAAEAPLRVDFLDVGQGDAALITSPTGKTVLVDAGPPESAARLAARLERLRGPIDLALLSHRHADHLGGLPRLVEEGRVRTFLDSSFDHPSPIYGHLLAALAARRVPVKEAVAGRRIDLGGGATLTLLGPPEPPLHGTRSDVNANSVVARLDYRRVAVLFCGDAEAETERWLLATGRPLSARVVKVAHHGSRYSSTEPFVRAVHAEVAVVSAGAGNDYGHPHAEALARWRAAGARIYRTDRDGEVSLSTDGDALTVATAKEPPGSPSPTAAALHADPAGAFVASRRSPVFHRADCPAAATIAPHNRIVFDGRDGAVASGRRPAEDCHP